jgi:multiple sugar transport system permease protein
MKRQNLSLYLMIAPYVVGTLLYTVLPALIAIALSFFYYDSLSAPIWAGLNNYIFISTYSAFTNGSRNTLTFIILAVPLRMIAMLALALLMRKPRRGIQLYRAAVYIPMVIPDIAYALLWMWIFNPLFGPVNAILGALGLPQPAWIVDRSLTFWVILLMSMFQIGEGFVVLLAGLADIPDSYYESAEVDGATRWQKFRFITFPLLRPWLVLLTFRDIVFGSQLIFTPAFIMMGGGRFYTAWFLPQMLYEESFGRLRYGVASATMVTWLIGAGLLLIGAYYVLRGWGYADEI